MVEPEIVGACSQRFLRWDNVVMSAARGSRSGTGQDRHDHTGHSDDRDEPGSNLPLIRMLLRQTPQQRLVGLRRAAQFFAKARRV